MKTKLFLLLALMLWGGIAINAQFAHESEPNNTFANATIIGLGDCVTSSIFPKSDEDFFKVDVPSTGVLVVFSNRTPAPVALDITIYDADQNTKINGEVANRNGQDIALETIVTKGTYYIKVKGISSSSWSSDSMYLCAWFDAKDSLEMNNSFAAASVVPVNSCVKATIRGRNYTSTGLSDDIDYYKISMPNNGVLTFSLSEVPSRLNLSFLIVTADLKVLAQSNTGVGLDASFALSLEKGDYYFVIDDYLSRTDSNTYKVCFELDTSDVFEENNSFSSAKPIAIDSCFEAKLFGYVIGKGSDLDYYSFEVTQGGEISVKVDNPPSELELTLSLYSSSKQLLKKVYASGKGKSVSLSDVVCKGQYFLAINDANSNQSKLFYSACLEFLKDEECGYDYNFAFESDYCDTVYASLRSNGDKDYFTFIGNGKEAIVKVSNVAPNIVAKVTVLDRDRKQLGVATSAAVGKDVSVLIPATVLSDPYVVLVESDNKSTSNTIYRFVVTDDNCKSLPPPPVAVNELVDANAISIFPNPSSGKFFIKIPAGEVSKISISNMLGQVVYSNDFYIGGVISLDEPDGVYFINIHHSNGYITKRLIINN